MRFEGRKQFIDFLRLSLISGGMFFVVIFLTLSVLVWVYRDDVKSLFIEKINAGLQSEVIIEDLRLGFFRTFPSISLTAHGVLIKEPRQLPNPDTLLVAEKIFFHIGLIDLLRGNYAVKKAGIENGSIAARIFNDGTSNFQIWKSPGEVTSGNKSFDFNIRRFDVYNIRFQFLDDRKDQSVDITIGDARMSGAFAQKDYLLTMKAETLVNALVIDSLSFISGQSFHFDMEVSVKDNSQFEISRGIFTIGGHQFEAEGSLDLKQEPANVDVSFYSEKIDLAQLLNDIPSDYQSYFQGFKPIGNLKMKADITGYWGAVVNPLINIDFSLERGELSRRNNRTRLTDINLKGAFTNGTSRNLSSSRLSIDVFHAKADQQFIEASGSITNFSSPFLDIRLATNLTAIQWQDLLPIKGLNKAQGELLVDIEFRGNLGEKRKMTPYSFVSGKLAGVIQATDLGFDIENHPHSYHGINTDLRFKNNEILIDKLQGNISSSDFQLNGYFRNVLPWLFFEDQRLFVSASLVSENINFNELLASSANESDTTYRLQLSQNIDFRLNAKVDNIAFRRFQASKVIGSLSLHDQIFYAENISLNAMKGEILASGYINGKNDQVLVIGCEAKIDNVDAYDLFYQMGNFGQSSISYDNLNGRITADARFISSWTPGLDIDWNSLEVTADLKVEDGELINYKPMLDLSRFIRVGDLNRVKFSTLENQIRIKNQVIIIPDMEIRSNAININISGEHTFNNEIDYRLQVLLSDLLARKNRESRNPQENYGDIIDDGLGRTTLFLRVTGTIDNPVFRYDTRALRDKLRDDLKQEGLNLRQVIRQEFGLSINDTLPDGSPVQPSERQEETEEIKKGEEGKFIIEWDN